MAESFKVRKIRNSNSSCDYCAKIGVVNEVLLPTVCIMKTYTSIEKIVKNHIYNYCDDCLDKLVKAIQDRKEVDFNDWD